MVLPRRARELRGRGYVKDARRGRDRRETGPKTRLCPRAHAYDACLRHTWKSSAALEKVKLWKLKVPLPADLCEKPPSEGCRGFQSLEVPKGGILAPILQWIEGVLYVLGYLLECHFLLLITCGRRTLAQAELMFLFFILLSLCFLYVVLVTFLL